LHDQFIGEEGESEVQKGRRTKERIQRSSVVNIMGCGKERKKPFNRWEMAFLEGAGRRIGEGAVAVTATNDGGNRLQKITGRKVRLIYRGAEEKFRKRAAESSMEID